MGKIKMKTNIDVCVWNWKGGKSGKKGDFDIAKAHIKDKLQDISPDLVLLSESRWEKKNAKSKKKSDVIKDLAPGYEVLQHPTTDILILYKNKALTYEGEISGQTLVDIVGSDAISNIKHRFLLGVFRAGSEPVLVGAWHGPHTTNERFKAEVLKKILKFMQSLCKRCSEGQCTRKHVDSPFNFMFLGGDFNLPLKDLKWEDKTLIDNNVTEMIDHEDWDICDMEVTSKYLNQRRGVREAKVIDYLLYYGPWCTDQKQIRVNSKWCKPSPYNTTDPDIKDILDHPPITASIDIEVCYYCNECERCLDKRARPLLCTIQYCEEKCHRGKKCSNIPSSCKSPEWYCKSHTPDSDSESDLDSDL